jgi:hypothetical protein
MLGKEPMNGHEQKEALGMNHFRVMIMESHWHPGERTRGMVSTQACDSGDVETFYEKGGDVFLAEGIMWDKKGGDVHISLIKGIGNIQGLFKRLFFWMFKEEGKSSIIN